MTMSWKIKGKFSFFHFIEWTSIGYLLIIGKRPGQDTEGLLNKDFPDPEDL